MSDIVERCQRGVVWISPCVCDGDGADDLLKEAAAEITRLRTELAEAQAAREQTIKNWEADIRAMNANRDTLRQQLAVAREGLAKEAAVRAMAVEMGKEWANQLADMILERDTLRQQLAVAREGLVVIRGVGETGNPFTSLRECGQIARDTLAKLEKP